VVDRQGGVFETRLDAGNIARYEGHADIQLDYGLDAAGMQAELTRLYGFATGELKVDIARNDGDVTYTVSFVREQAGIDFEQIVPVGDAQSSGLLPSPNASVDVATGTTRNGAFVNAGVNNLQTVTVNPNVTGGTFTVSFQIPDGKGGFDLKTSAPIAYNASEIDVYKALSPILNPNGSTLDIDPGSTA
jgi:hypothetical protein